MFLCMSFPITARHVRMALDCQRAAWLDEPSPASFVLALEELIYSLLWR